MIKTIFFLLSSLICLSSYANNQTPVPKDLMYAGKPIDALCFNLEGNTNTIHLDKCGIKKEKYSVNGLDNDLIKKGYIGYNWKDTSVSYPSEGSSYYKSFSADNNQYWIYSFNNTGGSGTFSAISLVKRINPNELTIKTVTSGDRCNGGIRDARQHGKQLDFDVNLTPFDLLALTNQNPHQLKAYDDLAACAACCAGAATYRINSDLTPKLMFVTLDAATPEEMSTQGKYQVCFNNILAQYIKSGKTKLNESQLSQLNKEFNDKCFK